MKSSLETTADCYESTVNNHSMIYKTEYKQRTLQMKNNTSSELSKP